MQVISLTKDKIHKDYINGRKIIVKKSSFDEIKNIEQARILLRNCEISINGEKYRFHLPHIYDYKNNEIYMEFLTGSNLEIDLRTPQYRNNAVNITNLIFQYIYDEKIYWGDFAPRNIMIDTDKHTINLCDFERGINSNITEKEYLQNYTYEEYAAFLFPKERLFSQKLNDIFRVTHIHRMTMQEIRSNRIKSIIREKNIPEDKITNQTVADINKMIILAETPYKLNGIDVFPIIDLEQTKDTSYQLFAQKVCNILTNKGNINGYTGRI